MKQKLILLPTYINQNTRFIDISDDELSPIRDFLSNGWKIAQISATSYTHNGVASDVRSCCYILLEKEK